MLAALMRQADCRALGRTPERSHWVSQTLQSIPGAAEPSPGGLGSLKKALAGGDGQLGGEQGRGGGAELGPGRCL